MDLEKKIESRVHPAQMDAAIFAHLALPAQLPQSEDGNLDAIEACLVDHLLATARTMRDLPSHEALGPRCLIVSKAVNSGGIVNKSKFLAELGHLGVGNALVLYIRSQNAALLIHRLAGYIYYTWLFTYTLVSVLTISSSTTVLLTK
jgi:hypothetical protein